MRRHARLRPHTPPRACGRPSQRQEGKPKGARGGSLGGRDVGSFPWPQWSQSHTGPPTAAGLSVPTRWQQNIFLRPGRCRGGEGGGEQGGSKVAGRRREGGRQPAPGEPEPGSLSRGRRPGPHPGRPEAGRPPASSVRSAQASGWGPGESADRRGRLQAASPLTSGPPCESWVLGTVHGDQSSSDHHHAHGRLLTLGCFSCLPLPARTRPACPPGTETCQGSVNECTHAC